MKRDETETRLSQNFSSETRPRRDQFQNFVRDRDETESLGTFSLETETLILHCILTILFFSFSFYEYYLVTLVRHGRQTMFGSRFHA